MSVSATGSADRNYLDLIGKDSNTTDNTKDTSNVYNAIFENNKDTSVSFEDFFDLMLQQLSNQDFMDPVDDTQYLSQLAEISSMQAMQEIAQYEKANYSMAYLGKEVTATKYNIGGTATNDRGVVSQVTLKDGEYELTVNGNNYKLSEISTVYNSNSSTDTPDDGSSDDTNAST